MSARKMKAAGGRNLSATVTRNQKKKIAAALKVILSLIVCHFFPPLFGLIP
jgi:hypothetical protein